MKFLHTLALALLLGDVAHAQSTALSLTNIPRGRAREVISSSQVNVPYQRAHRNIRLGIYKCAKSSSPLAISNVYPDLSEADITVIQTPGGVTLAFIYVKADGDRSTVTAWINKPLIGEGDVELARLAPIAAAAGENTDCAKAGYPEPVPPPLPFGATR